MKRRSMKVEMGKEKKTRKIRFNTIKEFAKSFNYDILSKNYSGPRTKMEFKCPEGHTFRMAYGDFKQGKRCPICIIYNKKDLKKFTIEKIEDLFGKEGYLLESKEYISSQIALESTCPEGHSVNISLYEFKKGIRCRECTKKAKGQTINETDVKNYINSQNYTLITKKIVNLESSLVMKCDSGHEVTMSYSTLKSGVRCQECVDELDTPLVVKAREILKDICNLDFNRETIENNKAVKMGHIKYDGYCKELKLIFDINESRDLNKLVFCRLNGIMYLRLSKNEINKEDIYQKLVDLGIVV
jgi:V8-like Glu-specific endopeptidase